MRKTPKINQTSYYTIQNELPKWHNYLVMCVQNRTPYWGVNVPRKAVAELGVSWQAERLGLPRWVEGCSKPLDLAIFIARALA